VIITVSGGSAVAVCDNAAAVAAATTVRTM
jgi:hypothetical protein